MNTNKYEKLEETEMTKKRMYSLKQYKMLLILTEKFCGEHKVSVKKPWVTIMEGTCSEAPAVVA